MKGRYVVTGGAGFVGSHLCERLLKEGAEVIAVDNFITGRPENVRPLLGLASFQLLEHDIVKPIPIEGGLAGIFHFASPASPVDYMRYPIETLRTGAIGSDNVLQLALEKRCRILVASTSEVYGDPQQHPQREDYWGNVNPIGPRGCYDESKRYLEALTMAYRRTLGVSTCIIRIFNTYGPRMRADDGRVVPTFCYQAIHGQELTVYGDGKQTRSFCYVDDLIEGILRAFQSKEEGPINLGNPDEMSIYEFAQQILKHAGQSSAITHRPLPQDDPKTRCPDISKAKRLLDWEPKIDLEEGLTRTFQYFREQKR